ncbi:hypothetical protein L7F22_020176 [Adiantum nelumboides]|nr:hypothetical protein [Adiantum nelumboides]
MAALTGCGLPSAQNQTTIQKRTFQRRREGATFLLPRRQSSLSACVCAVSVLSSSSQQQEESLSVELEAIASQEQFDAALRNAQQRSQPIVIDWVAAWCRKCIYLKPKLEKLAAEFQPNVNFYCVDVNAVPQTLVKRADVTVLPFNLCFFIDMLLEALNEKVASLSTRIMLVVLLV